MKTGRFIVIVLLSGCFAGIIYGALNLVIVEPYLDDAINIENQNMFSAGEEIIRMGDDGRNAYFIENGQVEVSTKKNGLDIVIAVLGPGEIFGEMSMIDDAPRSATVTAKINTEVIVIERSRFAQPLSTADPIMQLLLRVLLSRFRESQDLMIGFGSKALILSI